MFRNLEPLDRARHAGLCYRPAADYRYAGKAVAAPLTLSEVVLASRDCPVVFSEGDEITPLALLGLEKDQNACVDAEGRWIGGYVPAHIRRYPFMLRRTDTPGRHVLLIDRDAPQLVENDDAAEPLFVDGEIPDAGVIARARAFLARYEEEMRQTRALLAPLAEAGLLLSRRLTVEKDGSERVIARGFRMVDTEALGSLDPRTAGAWLRSGLLGQVFAHLHSLRALDRLRSSSLR